MNCKMLFRGGQKLTLIPSYLYDKFLAVFYRGAMKYCGKEVLWQKCISSPVKF